MRLVLLFIEILAFGVALVFGLLWLRDPQGPLYEPVLAMCGLIGTVLVGLIRGSTSSGKQPRDGGSTLRVEAEARYIIVDERVTSEDVWATLTRPFRERYKSWHPSYGDFEPVTSGYNGKAKEFEVRGSSGGRYPWKIEEWNDSARILRLWRGPSKNPPDGYEEIFLGLDLEFHVVAGLGTTLIDILYRERWSRQPWPTKEETFKNGPEREINWIFSHFPLKGRIDYVRALDASG
jgi:hypothetical protein